MQLAKRYLIIESLIAIAVLLVLLMGRAGWLGPFPYQLFLLFGGILLVLLSGNIVGIIKARGFIDELKWYLGGSIAIMAVLFINFMLFTEMATSV